MKRGTNSCTGEIGRGTKWRRWQRNSLSKHRECACLVTSIPKLRPILLSTHSNPLPSAPLRVGAVGMGVWGIARLGMENIVKRRYERMALLEGGGVLDR